MVLMKLVTKNNKQSKTKNQPIGEPIRMNTKHPLITLFGSITLVACGAIGGSGAPAEKYSLTDLGVLPDQHESSPAAINDEGQVAGTSGVFAFLDTSASKMEDVASVPTQFDRVISRGFGVNSSAVVVGDSSFGKDFRHAAVFRSGSATDLGTLKEGGNFSRANCINANAEIVGFSSEQLDLATGRAFIVNALNPSGLIDLGTLGGLSAQAWGINDGGFVTGNSQINGDLDATHAFIWDRNGGMRDLGTIAGNFSYGTFINKQNHVVGYSTITTNNDRVHAFFHNGNEMIDLGSLGGASLDSDNSYALGINASDQVVGYSYLPSPCPACEQATDVNPAIHTPPQVAFIYSDGLMANLNDLIGKEAENYRLDSATAINDEGQIVAMAFDNSAEAFHAVLLTPLKP
jgi:probable HAF family extracellular repeat protein